MHKNVTGKDLTREAPRSPRIRVGGYAILGRTIDKCRALVAGNIGEYHFDCPLDNMLFGFKGVKGDDFKAEVEKGATDQEMARWLDNHGEKKTPEEVKASRDGARDPPAAPLPPFCPRESFQRCMAISLKPQHLNRYRQIAWLFIKYGR